MPTTLVIVESATKAKKIGGYLGPDYLVIASCGHVRDLKEVGEGYEPVYAVTKKDRVASIRSAWKKCQDIILASDLDREGEAIAFHIASLLKLPLGTTKRATFREITKKAIQRAVANPGRIDMNLVNAQQGRRVIDMLLGFELSPLLQRHFSQRGLSAGRVQSVVARMVIDREMEADSFESASYFEVQGMFLPGPFPATLNAKFQGEPGVQEFLEHCLGATFMVISLEEGERQVEPPPPFETVTMQQVASKLMGATAEGVMKAAQALYEAGHITYHRTDSTELSEEAMQTMAGYIESTFGSPYSRPKQYKTEASDAQEAHEAIRPTNISLAELPEEDTRLEQRKLYQIIWKRALASQMSPTLFATIEGRLSVSDRPEQFVARGEEMVFDGFQVLYKPPEPVKHLPALRALEVGQEVRAKQIEGQQKLTKPRARFTEATLLKELKAKKIGRPATYATMVAKVQERGYVVKADIQGREVPLINLTMKGGTITRTEKNVKMGAEKGKLVPTEVGINVTNYLLTNFQTIMDYKFTAKMERELDRISSGKKEWREVVDVFYRAFHPTVETLLASLPALPSRREGPERRSLGVHAGTGQPMYAFTSSKGKHLLQIGDENAIFAELTAEQVGSITAEEANAIELYPRLIGEHLGKPVRLHKGRYGFYLSHGDRKCSVKEPPTNLEEAVEALSAEPKSRVIKKFKGATVMEGEHGPFCLMSGRIKSIPPSIDPAKITLKQCKALFAE